MTSSTSVKGGDELSGLLERYGEATERLRLSHDRLLSEVTRLSRELEQKNKLLDRKTRLEVLGEMAAGVAHEIRNPLGGILLYAGLLERDLDDSHEPLRLVRAIMTGVRSLNGIVDDLLSFTRGFEPSPTPCTLNGVVEDALRAAVGELARTEIRVVRDYAEGDLTVEADGELLRRAVLNLVLNAVQAMKTEGRLTARTGGTDRGGAAACFIEIVDTGPGISDEMMPRLF